MESVFKVSLVLDMVDKMSSGVGKAGSAVQGAFGGMTQAFGAMQKAGIAMTAAGTGIVGGCMQIAESTFDTQNALGELSSLGVEDLAAIENAAKSFSDTWAGTTKADFISASYDIKSGIASLSDEGIAQFTELAALTGKATKSTTETMGSLFATGYGIYKDYYKDMSDLEFGEMFSAGIATAVKNYKTNGQQMADAIGKLGATATNANVPMEEQLAILGQLQTTMSGSEAATKYNAFLQSAAGAGEKLGLKFTDANNQLLSTPDILDTLRGKYGDTLDAIEKQELKEAFGTDEAIKYIDLLYNKTGELKTGIDDMQGSMKNGISVTEDMAGAINNTPEQKFEVLKQKVHNTAEEFGKTLLPSVNNTIETVGNLIQRVSDWVSKNQDAVSSIMHIILYLGIFLITAGVLSTAVGTLGKTVSGLKGAFNAVKNVMSGGGFLGALGPIAIIAGAIIGLIALFEACGGDVSQLAGIFQQVFGAVGNIVSSALGTLATHLPGFLQFGFDLLMNLVSGILNGLPSLMNAGANMITSLLSGIGQMLPTITEMAGQMIVSFLTMVVSSLPSLLTAGAGMVTSILNGIVQLLPVLVQSGVQLILSLLSGLVQNLPTLLSAGAQMIATLLSGLIQMLPNIVSGGLSIIGSLASGILEAIPMLLNMGGQLVSSFVDTIFSTDWLAVGKDMLSGIADGVMAGIGSLVDSVKGAWGKFTDWLSGGADDDAAAAEIAKVPAEPAATAVPQTVTPNIVPDTSGFEMPDLQIDAGKYKIDGIDTTALQGVGDDIKGSVGEIDLSDMLQVSTQNLDTSAVQGLGSEIKGSLGEIDLSDALQISPQNLDTSAMQGLGSEIKGSLGEINLSDTFQIDTSGMAMGVANATSSIQSDVSGMGTSVTADMQSCWNDAASATTAGMSFVDGAVSSGMAKVRSTAVSAANSIASAIRSAFANIRVTVPAPMLPHVSVSYSTVGSGKASAKVPNFSVSYYADGGIMTNPTMFAYNANTNHGMVGGEAGPEAILPLTLLWNKMREIVGNVVYGKSVKTEKSSVKSIVSGLNWRKEVGSEGGRPQKDGGKKDRSVTIEHFEVNVDMKDADSMKKLLKLIDEIDTPEGDPDPVMA